MLKKSMIKKAASRLLSTPQAVIHLEIRIVVADAVYVAIAAEVDDSWKLRPSNPTMLPSVEFDAESAAHIGCALQSWASAVRRGIQSAMQRVPQLARCSSWLDF